MKKSFLLFIIFALCNILHGQTLVGTGQTYPTLKSAFDAINSGVLTGTVVLQITSSTTETASAVLNASGGIANYTSVTIYPTGTGYSISGSIAGVLIDLNGADNIIFDGRVNQLGSKDLTITNTNNSSSAATIRFINDASNNIIRFVTIKGMTTSTSGGVIFFSTSTASNGNDNNNIVNSDICDGTSKPKYLIYSSGTSLMENSGNTISNCNLYNFNGSTSAAAIYLSANSTNWTISNNSIYQSSAYTGTASSSVYGIYISSGENYTINGNFIGGSASNCGSNPWTINGTATNYKFGGIYLSIGTTITTNIQNNTIKNFNWLTNATATSTPGIWNAMYLNTGNVDIIGNTIGDSTGTGSITITSATTSTGAYCYGITTASTAGITNISDNILGSITVTGSTATALSALYVIHTSGGSSVTVNNNLVGSLSTPNSINLANPSTSTTNQFVNCIYNNAPGTVSITNNTIANIYNNYKANGTNAANICGIFIGGGTNNITGNTIRNLSSTGTTTGTGIGTCITGIFVRDNSLVTGNQLISQNTIYNLSNSATSAAISISGIIFDAPSNSSTNIIERNKIYNLNLSTTGAGIITGIYSSSSGTSTTYKNNMISLGNNLANGYTIYGLMDSTGINNYYYNSVYIGGLSVIGLGNTYAFNSLVTNNARNFKNNIFYNARANGTGSGKHYAVKVAGTTANPTGLSIDYNDYFANGIGGVIGFYNNLDIGTLSAWKTAVGQDVNSINSDPKYSNAEDLHIMSTVISPVNNVGNTISSVTNDFDGDLRSNTPDIGADEFSGMPVLSCSGTPDISIINGLTTVCSGNSTSLSLSTTYNFFGIKYQWKSSSVSGGPYSNLDTLITQSTGNLTSPKYFICVITCINSGLSYTTSEKMVSVTTPPSATITYTSSPYCKTVTTAQAVTLSGTSGGIFSALPTGLTLNPTTGFITPFSSNAGSYTITYKIDSAGGCAAYSTTANVIITTAPSATISYAGSPFCKTLSTAQSVSLNGTSGGTYSALPSGLTINATTGAIIPGSSTAGSYTVTYLIAASGGCAAVSTNTSVTVTSLPTATISYTGSPYCNNVTTNQNAILTGTSGGTYAALPLGLTINATTGAIIPVTSNPGSYTVSYTIPATGGCAAVSATTQVGVLPLPAAAGTIFSLQNDSVFIGETNVLYKVQAIANATTYFWSYSGTGVTFIPAAITITDSVRINFSATATSGNLTVKGHNACGDGSISATYHIYVSPVGINEITNAFDYNISPNPSTGIITIEIKKLNSDLELQILNLQGKVIRKELIGKFDQNYSFNTDLSIYPKGIYFIRFINKNFTKVEKVILQ